MVLPVFRNWPGHRCFLVGALMQYTESNLGIPEERVQYLARVGQWLVTDWATAQGHPPDPYRSLYPKILPRLAFAVHKSERSECALGEATQLLASWLPKYGFQSAEATAVLRQILIRTGILVRDVPERVIFAQFGLQEYYASTIAIDELTVDGVRQVCVKPWWREVILLAIAQRPDPDRILENLFQANPVLAVVATAECPTPSLEYQHKSVEFCLGALRQSASDIQSSTIALLRKLRGPEESTLVVGLESELSSSQEIASSAAGMLARAGTLAATSALAKHPERWKESLDKVGYLSSTFEDMLVTSIRNDKDADAILAIDLLTPRLSNDRYWELVNMLPSLRRERSDYLARSLLVYRQGDRPDRDRLFGIASCAAFVTDVQAYLVASREKRELPDRWEGPPYWINRSSLDGPFEIRRFGIPGGLFDDTATSAVFLAQQGARSAKRIFTTLRNAYLWSMRSPALLVWSTSALVIALGLLGRQGVWPIALSIAAAALALRPGHYSRLGRSTVVLYIVVGMLMWWAITGADLRLLSSSTPIKGIAVLALIYLFVGATVCDDYIFSEAGLWRYVLVAVTLWAAYVVCLVILAFLVKTPPIAPFVASLPVAACLSAVAWLLWLDYARLSRAARQGHAERQLLKERAKALD